MTGLEILVDNMMSEDARSCKLLSIALAQIGTDHNMRMRVGSTNFMTPHSVRSQHWRVQGPQPVTDGALHNSSMD